MADVGRNESQQAFISPHNGSDESFSGKQNANYGPTCRSNRKSTGDDANPKLPTATASPTEEYPDPLKPLDYHELVCVVKPCNRAPWCEDHQSHGGLTTNLVFAISAAALGSSWQFGYNIGVVNAPQKIVQGWINELQQNRTGKHDENGTFVPGAAWPKETIDLVWSWIVSAWIIGGCIGGISTAFWVNRFGRKGTLMLNNSMAIIAAALFGFCKMAKSWEMILVARFISGLNSGINSGAAPMYLSEISPVNLRGAVGSIHQLVVTISILVAQILGMSTVLGNEEGWPILFAMVCVPAFYQLAALPFCPESPRFLLINKEQEGRAQKALIQLRKTSDVYDEMDEMKLEHQRQQEGPKMSWKSLFTIPHLRLPMLIVSVIMISQQLSGINAVMFYSTSIFNEAGLKGDDAVYATIRMGCVNVLMTIVSVVLVEKAGRRTLQLTGLGGMFFTTLSLTVAMHLKDDLDWMTYICIVMVILFVISFATGPGSIPWFITAELFDQSSRPAAISIAVLLNWAANFFVGLGFLPLAAALNEFVFLVFSVLLAIFFAFTWKFVPETKNKTIEEITSQFKKGYEPTPTQDISKV